MMASIVALAHRICATWEIPHDQLEQYSNRQKTEISLRYNLHGEKLND